MTSSDDAAIRERAAKCVGLLGETVPKEGAFVWAAENNVEPGMYFFGGNRAGFARLGLALLKFAAEADVFPGGERSAMSSARDYFTPPSELRHLGLQLEVRPSRPGSDARSGSKGCLAVLAVYVFALATLAAMFAR